MLEARRLRPAQAGTGLGSPGHTQPWSTGFLGLMAVTLMTLNFAISVSRLAQRRPGSAGRVLWSIGFQITTGSQLHSVG